MSGWRDAALRCLTAKASLETGDGSDRDGLDREAGLPPVAIRQQDTTRHHSGHGCLLKGAISSMSNVAVLAYRRLSGIVASWLYVPAAADSELNSSQNSCENDNDGPIIQSG